MNHADLGAILGILGAFLTFLTTLVGITIKIVYDRFREYREEINEMRSHHDAQITQVKDEHRLEYAAVNVKLADLQSVDRIKDDYIFDLRDHIDRGLPPPPPDWPAELTRRR